MRKIFILLSVAFLLVAFASAQTRPVSGKVTDAKDSSPLSGITIKVKSTTAGTSTAADGSFTIDVNDKSDVLIVSGVGFQSTSIKINNDEKNVSVKLMQSTTNLNEVIVTAVGISRAAKSLGYSVATIKGDEITKARETNIVNALAGKISGVRVTSQSGTLGGGSKVIIRGASSLSGSSQPLFVIDGLPLDNSSPGNGFGNGSVDYGNRAGDVNSDDVESISVLKGAAATALYGSRGKSGAIVITTKKGSRRSTAAVTVNSSYRFDNVLKLPKFQNEYANGNYGVYSLKFVNGWGPKISDVQDVTVKDFKGDDVTLKAFPDNVKNFYETGISKINTVSVAGGTENTDYRLSLGNTDQTGVVPGSKLNRYNINFNAGRTFNDKLSARTTISYIRTTSVGRPTQSANDPNVLTAATFFPRSLDVEKLRNNYVDPVSGAQIALSSDRTGNNPFWIINNNQNNNELDRVVGNVVVSYKPLSWLNITNNLGTDFYNEFRRTKTRKGTFGQLDGAFSLNQIYSNNLNNDLLITAEKKNIIKDLDLKVIAGNNFFQSSFRTLGVRAQNLTVDNLYNLGNAATKDPTNYYQRYSLVGVFGDIGLSYKNYAFLNVTGRNDWTSTLPVNNRSYFYPSVSGSFVFTELIKPSNILNFGKIRAGWANVGSGTDPYLLDFAYTPATDYFVQYGLTGTFPTAGGLLGFSGPGQLPNANLKPQNQASIEIGTELRFFDSRIQLEATYYNTKTTNQILGIEVPLSTGYFTKSINAGSITNKGIEIDLRLQPLRNLKGFNWNVDLNFNKNRQIVDELSVGLQSYTLNSAYSGLVIKASPGQAFGIWGTDWLRDPDGNIVINQSTGLRQTKTDVRFGDIFPEWTMGINNTFSYKGFSLSGLVDIRQGGVMFSGTVSGLRTSGLAIETLNNRGQVFVDKGVYKNADGKYLPNTIPVQSMQDFWSQNFQTSNTVANVFDASYAKLREIRISYQIPVGTKTKHFVKGAEIGIEARNVLLLKSYVPHVDPEVNVFGPNEIGEGVEFYNVPSTRSVGVNVRLSF